MPCLAALPLLGSAHGAGALGLLADYLGRHPWLHAAFALPEDVARDLGRIILACQVLLQIAAGFAAWRLFLRLGLDEAAPVGAVLYELVPAFAGADVGGGIGVAATAPMVLAAVEHCLAPRRPNAGGGVLALAGAVALLGGFGGHGGFLAVMSFASLWTVIRLAHPAPAPRSGAPGRLIAGACLGTLLAFPLLVRHFVFAVNRDAVDLDGLEDFFRAGPGSADPEATLRALCAMLPVLALGILAWGRGRPAMGLRVLLGLVAAASAAAIGLVPALPGIGPDDARPLLALSGVILATASVSDLARGRKISRAALLAAAALIAMVGIAAARTHATDPRVLAGEMVAAALCVMLAAPRRAARRALAFLVVLAAAASFEVTRLGT